MEFWLIILCLILSGFFSGSETVFLSVNRIRLEGFLHKRRPGAKSAVWFSRKPSRFILTTLVGTNLANIAFATLATAYLIERGVPTVWITPLGAVIILVFGEVIPKSLGRDLAEPSSLWAAPILRFFRILFYPLSYSGELVSSIFIRIIGINKSEVGSFFSRGDLEVLIRESEVSERFDKKQKTHISRILKFRTLQAKDVMTPRTEIVALDSASGTDDLLETALSSGFSKIPVFQEDIDHIVGVTYTRDLFDNPDVLSDIIKPIASFPEQRKAYRIFKDLRSRKQSMAMIIDEWGGTAGLITVEDLIEELTGDIEDEYDPARLSFQQIAEGRWLVSARMEVEELNHRFNLQIPEGDYETLGGYLMDALGRIPEKGESIEIDGYCFEIIKATRTRIRIVILQKVDDDN